MEQMLEQVAAMRGRGYNCAQCVASYTLGQYGVSGDAVVRAARGMAGGLGSGHNCGCVLGAALAFGVLMPGEDRPSMREATLRSAEMARRFEAEFGSLECAVLKGEKHLPCDALIAWACGAAVALLEEAGVAKESDKPERQ